MIIAIVQGLVGFGLLALVQLGLFLPTAGIIARRLQDTGKNGALVWVLMIPVLISSTLAFIATMAFGGVGLLLIFLPLLWLLSLISLFAAVCLILLCVQPGTAGPNAYGPPPQQRRRETVTARVIVRDSASRPPRHPRDHNAAVLNETSIWNDDIADLAYRHAWWQERVSRGYPSTSQSWTALPAR